MKGRDYRISGSLANADIVVDRTFWVGLYPGLGEAHLDYMIETIDELVRTPERMAV
jgi:CDP-6-deoxy-D-xylo-4-hexulose-3-dehydrase